MRHFPAGRRRAEDGRADDEVHDGCVRLNRELGITSVTVHHAPEQLPNSHGVGSEQWSIGADDDEPPVAHQHPAQVVGELLECVAPVQSGVRRMELSQNEVSDFHQEVVPTRDVAVERGRPGAELVREPSHREFSETLLVDDLQRRSADLFHAQAVTAGPQSLQVAIPPPSG